jgi:hypothetical protein
MLCLRECFDTSAGAFDCSGDDLLLAHRRLPTPLRFDRQGVDRIEIEEELVRLDAWRGVHGDAVFTIVVTQNYARRVFRRRRARRKQRAAY